MRRTVSFYSDEVADYVIDNTKIGDKAYDYDNEIYVGNVTEIKSDVSRTYAVNANGEVVLGSKENFSSVYISVEVEGTVSENGLIIDDTLYGVGQSVALFAGYGKYYIKVHDIQVLD